MGDIMEIGEKSDLTDRVINTGGDDRHSPLVIAGPCSAESEEQVLAVAHALRDGGIGILRAGVWKPRTKPGGFEGMGSKALAWLMEAKRETGLRIATEVATGQHVKEAVEAGVDVLWIGARTSANPFAVQEIADALARYPRERRDGLTVMVKNPVNPDLELWIGAIERIRGAGIGRLVAIHRGFSSYGRHIYRNPPKWRIPIELRRRMPDLTIICDPSHIGGKRELVATISQQALDMGFDGLMIECHPEPESALSDSAQQLTPPALLAMLGGLRGRSETPGTEPLEEMRGRIDSIDDELLDLLAKRMRVSKEIGRYKEEHGMPVLQKDRYNSLMQQRVEMATELGLDESFVRNILAAIHEESVRQQLKAPISQKNDNGGV